MTAIGVATRVYQRQRPRLVAAALRQPKLAAGLLAVRNKALSAMGRPEHAQRLADAVRAAAAIGSSDAIGVRAWPRGPLRWTLLDGLPGSASSRYRIEALARSLRADGHSVHVVVPDDLQAETRSFLGADVVVLFRVTASDGLLRVVTTARDLGATVLYDIDDLVFDRSIANPSYVDGLRFLSPAEQRMYEHGVQGYQDALMACDAAIVPTDSLARRVNALGKAAFVVPNSVLGAWEDPSLEHTPDPSTVVIGYASGTKTHQADFAVVAAALPAVLTEHEHVVLHVVGHLDVMEYPELAPFRDRIHQLPAVPFDSLAEVVGRFDINLAPLDVGNPYCEAKSELKYFEAAQVGVPTVASPTATYRHAIRSGENGMLATSSADWTKALSDLVADAELRERLVRDARLDVAERYSASAHAGKVAELVSWLRQRRPSSPEVVTLLLPGVDAGGGGASKAMDLFRGLAGPSRHLQVVLQNRTASFPDARSIDVAYRLSHAGIAVLMSENLVPSSDVTVTTFYTTALQAAEAGARAGDVVQLLQDYEPWFFPMSPEYLAARRSLELPQRQVSYGPWVANMVREHHGRDDVASVPFYIDHDMYRPCCDAAMCAHADDCEESHVEILALARPEMARRCYPLVVDALGHVAEELGDTVRISFFGSDLVRQVPPRYPHVDLGILKPTELAKLYRRSDLGVVVSPTNPSMVPFEMMACGLPVVDLDVPFNADNYGGADNVFLAQADAEGLAEKIVEAVHDKKRRREVAARGLRWAGALPTAEAVRAEFAAKVLR